MRFFVGLHQPSDARLFADRPVMLSVNRLRRRRSDFAVGEWVLDSGAFTELRDHGRYRDPPDVYAAQVRRWSRCGSLLAAVSQDWMCEELVIKGGRVRGQVFVGTGLSVPEHQRLTVERYDALLPLVGETYLMPVLQGYWPDEYLRCVDLYGDRLRPGMWVGVGSVCKRNSDLESIERVLWTVKHARPDLLLHGFGVKTTALGSSLVRACLHSADSMAWSYAARMQGRDSNDPAEAEAFAERIRTQPMRRRHFQRFLW